MAGERVKMEFSHNGHRWQIVYIDGSYFARCNGSDTGPYSTQAQAYDFITQVKK